MALHSNEYDSMKYSLNLLRDFKKSLIKEDITPSLQPQELEDEQNKFKEAVSPNVQFGEFRRLNSNIEFNGVIIKEKISWLFSLADGCIISCDGLVLSDDTVKIIQQLSAYYTTWSSYWGSAQTQNSQSSQI